MLRSLRFKQIYSELDGYWLFSEVFVYFQSLIHHNNNSVKRQK